MIDRIPVKAVRATTSSIGAFPENPGRRDRGLCFADPSNRLRVDIEPAPWVSDCANRLHAAAATGVLQLVVGDYTEPGASTKAGPCANAALIEVNLAAGYVFAISSIVGLPPITLRKDSRFQSMSCPLFPVADATSSVDIDGVADTLRWGHPLDGRTVYSGLVVVPPYSSVILDAGKSVTVQRLHTTDPLQSYGHFSAVQLLEAQIAAMLGAAKRMPTSGTFLSLSGGLDSRTASVALLSQGNRMPCVSMAASPYSLDGQIAREFCIANGLPHESIVFREDYYKRLPGLVQQSAALTGGVASLSQTVDLYLYSCLDSTSHIRVSGHLGNQVGRGGVESIAAATLNERIFSEDLRQALELRPREAWFLPRMAQTGYASVLFEQEVHYWSVANFMLGSSRALQLSPYADVTLIELSRVAISRDPRFRNPTRVSIRRRDLRHRLFGPPIPESFQRTMLIRYGTAGREVPINWGWRARGGWSVRGRPAAVRFAADAFACKMGRQYKLLKSPMTRLSRALGNPSELVAWQDVIKGPLRELTCDTLLSKETLESGLFNPATLRSVLDEHFQARSDHHGTIVRALEIALGLASQLRR
jgi:hypothetical protein